MVPDWIAYAALVVLLIGSVVVGVVLALAAILVVRAVQAGLSRLQTRRRTEARRERLVQQLARPGLEYVACHTTTCGHMQTPHYPDGSGQLVCEACGTPAAATAP